MKHYFYFKKGQDVPQWLLRQRDANTGESLSVAQFKSNGKVMVDDSTGSAVMWAASKRNKCLIYVDGGKRPVSLDTDDRGSQNYAFTFPRYGKKVQPLVSARNNEVNVVTTTRCTPIPAHFDRTSSAGGDV